MVPGPFACDDKKAGTTKSQDAQRGSDQEHSILRAMLELDGYRHVKIDRTPWGYLRVDFSIGAKLVSLLIDTGSPATCLDRNRTRDLNLKWVNPNADHPFPGDLKVLRKGSWYCDIPSQRKLGRCE